YLNFAPKFKGRYLSSNVNITVADEHGNVVNVPVGGIGRQITSLGVLYDFTDNDVNTTVQKVEDMVKERWFAEAIEEEPDFHMPVQRDNWPLVFNAVRAVHPYTPILILGGHTHIRDCGNVDHIINQYNMVTLLHSVQLDGRSMSLESGRYMETVGWMSAKLDNHVHTKNSKQKPKDIKFSRRYLDPNRVTYEYHTRKEKTAFDTKPGQSITAGLKALAAAFNLDFLFGTAPHDYTVNRCATHTIPLCLAYTGKGTLTLPRIHY
ncbi:hypothetical protein C0993_009448, partial [Termitomyces sp. T159_Od127]